MNWILNLLFPSKSGTIRISPDHLPGIKPPRAAPFIPPSLEDDKASGPSVKDLYERFLANGGNKATPTKRKGKGLF